MCWRLAQCQDRTRQQLKPSNQCSYVGMPQLQVPWSARRHRSSRTGTARPPGAEGKTGNFKARSTGIHGIFTCSWSAPALLWCPALVCTSTLPRYSLKNRELLRWPKFCSVVCWFFSVGWVWGGFRFLHYLPHMWQAKWNCLIKRRLI